MLETLLDETKWNEYLTNRCENHFLSKKEKKDLRSFIDEKRYIQLSTAIADGGYKFSIPVKKLIAKNGVKKKRTVYTFQPDEMMMLKYIAYQMYQYDHLFSDNLYSFRRSKTVGSAILSLKYLKKRNYMYGYKMDISNYFNSIDKDILLPKLKKDVDADIYQLIEKILSNPYVSYRDEIIEEHVGALAGQPLSSFLADYYLKDVDAYFHEQRVFYLRYADDIILFCNSEKDRDFYRNKLLSFLNDYHLTTNPEKEKMISPGDNFDFLGFSFQRNKIDVSSHQIKKMIGKIRRSSKGIRRWCLKKNVDLEKGIKYLIKRYNRRFFGSDKSELSWKFYYFPYLNQSNGLHQVDEYFQDELRFIKTGKHCKKNYASLPYAKLKEMGYLSLVHEYYKFINEKSDQKSDLI